MTDLPGCIRCDKPTPMPYCPDCWAGLDAVLDTVIADLLAEAPGNTMPKHESIVRAADTVSAFLNQEEGEPK